MGITKILPVILLALVGAVFSAPGGYSYKLIGYSPNTKILQSREKILKDMDTNRELLKRCPSTFTPSKQPRVMTLLRVVYKGKEVDAVGVLFMDSSGLGYTCVYRIDYPELDTKEAQVIEEIRSRYSFKALLESGNMPSLPEFLTDIIFGKVGDKKISSFTIAKEHPTFAFLINFRKGFGELFDQIKLWVMFLSLAGFMMFLMYGVVYEKVKTGQVDVVLYLRRNLVYLGALLFFTFPLVGHDTVAWKAIEFSTSVAHFLANKIAGVFVDAYMDTKVDLAKRNVLESIKVGNQTITTLLVSARGTAALMKDYCCAFFGDENKKEGQLCRKYLDDAGNSVLFALQQMESAVEKALKSNDIDKVRVTLAYDMRKAREYLEEARLHLSEYRQKFKSSVQASNGCISGAWMGTYDRERMAEDSTWTPLYDRLSAKINLADEGIKGSQEMQDMITDYVRNFKEIKQYTKDYIEAAGWVAVPTIYFTTMAPFLSYESEKGEELSYQKQMEEKKELDPSALEKMISDLPLLGLPPMYQIFSAGMNVVNSLTKQVVSGGIMKGIVGKLLGIAGGMSPWLVLLLGGLAYIGAVMAVAYLSIALGFFLLEILAQAAVLVAFWLKVASFLKEA